MLFFEEGNFAGWMYKVIRNEFINNYNKFKNIVSDLEQCYLSRIKLLKDNPDFMKLVSLDQYRLDEEYESVKKPEDVKAVGICGTIKKADFLKMIKTGDIKYANILDVKLSSFN